MVDMESLIPAEHLLREVDVAMNYEKLHEIVEPLYSEGCCAGRRRMWRSGGF